MLTYLIYLNIHIINLIYYIEYVKIYSLNFIKIILSV